MSLPRETLLKVVAEYIVTNEGAEKTKKNRKQAQRARIDQIMSERAERGY